MAFNISNKIKQIIKFDAQKHTADIVNSNQQYLAELLKTQLEVGQDGNGKPVTIRGVAGYKPKTIANKRLMPADSLSRVTRWVTNYMTGAFYAGIKPITDGKSLTFDSNVPYFQDIIAQSGGIIMKLNDYNIKKFKEEILIPELERRMKIIQ